MVNKDQEQEIFVNHTLFRIIKKILSIILLFFSISLLSILISFDALDQGWGIISERPTTNIYSEIGAWFSGLIIREFGIFPGLLLSLVLFIWSLKLFNNSLITYVKTKLFAIIFMIFMSSLGASYIETILVKKFNLNSPIISQRGLSEWLLSNFSNLISKISGFDITTSEFIIGISFFVLSLILFTWILSLNSSETKLMKFVIRPLLMPLIWVFSMFYHLFFVSVC